MKIRRIGLHLGLIAIPFASYAVACVTVVDTEDCSTWANLCPSCTDGRVISPVCVGLTNQVGTSNYCFTGGAPAGLLHIIDNLDLPCHDDNPCISGAPTGGTQCDAAVPGGSDFYGGTCTKPVLGENCSACAKGAPTTTVPCNTDVFDYCDG